ncbi:MAG: LysR family transcriptional regulator, partial [Bradyrhizobium sp.]
MSLSMDQLESFVAAAEQGSFSGAARLLKKAQSSILVKTCLQKNKQCSLVTSHHCDPLLTHSLQATT